MPFLDSICRGVGVCLVLFFAAGFLDADEIDSTARSAETQRLTKNAAKSFQFELTGEPAGELVLHPNPILHWSNPVAGEIYGNVFVWTRQGRPEVVGSIHQWYSPHTHGAREFHSLATGPVSGKRYGRTFLETEEPGIEPRAVPEQQPVAETQLGRLRQMRAIARQFTVHKTDEEGVTREMRLLSQPVYRYPAPTPDVSDGALFAFVQGTDPEVFLLLESRRAGDNWQWRYGLARMNRVQFIAKHKEREVWRVDILPWQKVSSGQHPYVSGRLRDEPRGDREREN